MLRHTLTHPYTDDDNDPDTDSFYRRLLDLMSELTEIANDNVQSLEIEYDEDLKRVVLSVGDPQKKEKNRLGTIKARKPIIMVRNMMVNAFISAFSVFVGCRNGGVAYGARSFF